jgi:hypothetical protein
VAKKLPRCEWLDTVRVLNTMLSELIEVREQFRTRARLSQNIGEQL